MLESHPIASFRATTRCSDGSFFVLHAGVNINTIREMVGHTDERTTYNSYCFDRTDKSERQKIVEAALS